SIKYGIPVNITDRFDLARSPVVVAILNLLKIPLNRFRRDDVLRGVSTQYFDLWAEKSRLDTGNLAAVSQSLKITRGYSGWIRRIDKEASRLNPQLHETKDPFDETVLKRQLQSLSKARSDIEWLQNLLEEIGREATPRQFRANLFSLLDRLHVSFRILKNPSATTADLVEKDSQAYKKLLEVIEQLVQLNEFQEEKEKSHPLRFYFDQLKVAISQERYNVVERFRRGVLVTSIEETRGLPLDVMIVAGLVDGEFPSAYQSEVFFSSRRQKKREQRHMWENRYLFYQAITNWSEHLYLTYPEQEADLDLVRSSFVDAMLSVAEVEHWKYPGKNPFGNDVYSDEEMLRHYGEAVGSGWKEAERLMCYLPEKAPAVRAAIDIERSRVETHSLPEYEGIVFAKISDEGRERLTQFKDRVYSVSQLETYGKCPYQFFASRVLRLNMVEDMEEGLSPLEKGSVVHQTLYEFYVQRREKKLPLISECTDREFELAVQDLVTIARKKFREKDIPDPFWQLEQELILGDAAGGGVLRAFLEAERKRSTRLEPRYFEVGFGSKLGSRGLTDPELSVEEPLVAGNVKLRGKVDRVELGEGVFTIIDYKTGKTLPKFDDLRKGLSLQLPIYLYAVEKLLQDRLQRNPRPAGGLYYQLREAVHLRLGLGSAEYNKSAFDFPPRLNQMLESDDALREILNEAIDWANLYVCDIAEGKFPLTSPDKVSKVCTICDFNTVCRIQTVQRVESQHREEQ
ncbi:MAG: exodeoxyribonuclease V subunit gamma, partial [Ignavibacteriae bacterium]|nr:exodeoxyribonuclease V subunit gamma [Ignavibacteriota bacterium]